MLKLVNRSLVDMSYNVNTECYITANFGHFLTFLLKPPQPFTGLFFLFLKQFLKDISSFCGATDTPCFGLLVMSPLVFKARVGYLICTWQRCTYKMFHEIHHWCDTCWPHGGQHGSQAVLFHLPVGMHCGAWKWNLLCPHCLTVWDQTGRYSINRAIQAWFVYSLFGLALGGQL